jgi:hypothetical protein
MGGHARIIRAWREGASGHASTTPTTTATRIMPVLTPTLWPARMTIGAFASMTIPPELACNPTYFPLCHRKTFRIAARFFDFVR